jgi:hypothetical protein
MRLREKGRSTNAAANFVSAINLTGPRQRAIEVQNVE